MITGDLEWGGGVATSNYVAELIEKKNDSLQILNSHLKEMWMNQEVSKTTVKEQLQFYKLQYRRN